MAPEYRHEWTEIVTPGGLVVPKLRAGRRTSGSGVTGSLMGQPTPAAHEPGGTPEQHLARKRAAVARGAQMGCTAVTTQAHMALLAGHPTPACNEPDGAFRPSRAATGRTTDYLGRTAQLAGHPTPQHHDTQEQGKGRPLTESGRIRCHNGKDASLNLPGMATLASHPSPRAADCEQTGAHRGNPDTLPSCSRLTGHPTCSARDWKDTPGMATTGTNPDGSERSRLDMLPRVSALAGHATPRVTTNSGIGNPDRACDGKARLEDQCLGAATASTDTSTAKTGGYRLNPGFSLWLMLGIPGIVAAWASCGERAMQSCRRSRRSS